MEDIFEYKTIKKSVEDALLKIKGSKFYGLIFNVNNEEEVKSMLLKTKEIYPNATHYCYSYRIGIEGEKYRANDDGEPSGTAGLPIYNQLLSSEITNVLLIVVRYYGGTKLGVSGLIKAYKETAQYAIEQAEIIIKELADYYNLQFEYNHQTQIMNLLKKLDIEIIESNFTEKCSITISLPKKKEDNFNERFSSLINQNYITINKLE